MQVPSEMAIQYQDVLSAQDIAVYGGLCALASFDRSELQSHVINNVTFRDYMEVNPEVMLSLLNAAKETPATSPPNPSPPHLIPCTHLT